MARITVAHGAPIGEGLLKSLAVHGGHTESGKPGNTVGRHSDVERSCARSANRDVYE